MRLNTGQLSGIGLALLSGFAPKLGLQFPYLAYVAGFIAGLLMLFWPTVAEVNAWIAVGNYWPTVQTKQRYLNRPILPRTNTKVIMSQSFVRCAVKVG